MENWNGTVNINKFINPHYGVYANSTSKAISIGTQNAENNNFGIYVKGHGNEYIENNPFNIGDAIACVNYSPLELEVKEVLEYRLPVLPP